MHAQHVSLLVRFPEAGTCVASTYTEGTGFACKKPVPSVYVGCAEGAGICRGARHRARQREMCGCGEGRDIERASARCDRCLTNTHPGHMVKMHNEFEFWLTIITITPSQRLWINPPEKGTILRYSQSYPHYQQFSTIYITLRL